MYLKKNMLDKKIRDCEPEYTGNKTHREYIIALEDEFNIPHKDLDSMTDEELDTYDTFLWEISWK